MVRLHSTKMMQNVKKKKCVCYEEARGKDAWVCSTIFRSCCFSMTSGSCLALTLPHALHKCVSACVALLLLFVPPKLCKNTVSVLSCE